MELLILIQSHWILHHLELTNYSIEIHLKKYFMKLIAIIQPLSIMDLNNNKLEMFCMLNLKNLTGLWNRVFGLWEKLSINNHQTLRMVEVAIIIKEGQTKGKDHKLQIIFNQGFWSIHWAQHFPTIHLILEQWSGAINLTTLIIK